VVVALNHPSNPLGTIAAAAMRARLLPISMVASLHPATVDLIRTLNLRNRQSR
jgi:hypothetical protein